MAQVGFCSRSGTLCTLCLLAACRTSQILSHRVWALLSKFVMLRAALAIDRRFFGHMDERGLQLHGDGRSFTAASELSGMALLAWVLRELVEWGAFAGQIRAWTLLWKFVRSWPFQLNSRLPMRWGSPACRLFWSSHEVCIVSTAGFLPVVFQWQNVIERPLRTRWPVQPLVGAALLAAMSNGFATPDEEVLCFF